MQNVPSLQTENWQKQEVERKTTAESSRRLSDLHKVMNDIESFIDSNVSEKLANYERDIETYQKSLTELMDRRKNAEKTIGKLKEDVTFQEIKKREMLDNVTLRETKETMETLKKQCLQLSAQLKDMNYDEVVQEWKELESKKQATLRTVSDEARLSCIIVYTLTNILYDCFVFVFFFQRNVSLGKQEELERSIKQYNQELRKEDYRLARRNFINKCIELTVKYHTRRSDMYLGCTYT